MGLRDRLADAGLRARAAYGALVSPSPGGDLGALAKAGPSRTGTTTFSNNANRVSGSGRLPPASGTPDDDNPQAPTQEALVDPKALYWDPFALVEQLGYKEKPTAITYGTLQAMTWKVPIIQAIIQTRVNQASAFATPQVHRFDPGFRIRMRDPEEKPTRADKKFIKQLEHQIMMSGVHKDARHHDSFETFLRKIVRDSLIYDQMCFEVQPGRDGRPAAWNAVDAATIRRADTRKLFPDDSVLGETKFVQIYDNTVIAEFSAEEMSFGIRNPRTDIRSQQYGTSELEMLVSTVTSILYAWNYNQNFFSQGTVAKGILNIVGSIPEQQLRAFRRLWYQQIAGVENAWRTPITNAEKLEWHNLQQSNRDMEFSAWMDFLIKVACAIYQMDPIEVNFKYGVGGAKSMFDSSNRAKLTESKDRGLRPLLRFVARELDKHIIWPIDENFTFEFVGLDSQTPKELADLNTQRVRTIYTLDEVRAENDLPPLPNGDGKVILDTNWLAARRERLGEEQQKREQAEAAAHAAAQATPLTDVQVQDPTGGMMQTPPQEAGAAAQTAVPQAGGSAPGAVPGAGTGKKPAGPDKDDIAELEGLLKPSHSSRVDKSFASGDQSVVIDLEI